MKKLTPLLICVLLFGACEQNTTTETDKAATTRYKYTTEIPPGITIADKVETRLGTLTFKDGFPDDSTVQKVYDNLDFSRGVLAFMNTMPAASVVAQRRSLRQFGPDNGTVIVFETLMDARSLSDCKHGEHLCRGMAESSEWSGSSGISSQHTWIG